jgi:DNA-binding response OmpR family regulator
MNTRRLLIVEDHAMTRNALRGLFARQGWDVRVAESVAKGLAALEPPPDCLLLDLMLPDGDGETILRKIRADGLPTRVAVCTGTGDPERLRAVSELRPDALLHKPIDITDLCRACDPSA